MSQDFECGVTNLECRVQTLSHESGPWIHIWSEGSGLGVTSVYLEARGWTWSEEDGLGVRSQDPESGLLKSNFLKSGARTWESGLRVRN